MSPWVNERASAGIGHGTRLREEVVLHFAAWPRPSAAANRAKVIDSGRFQ